MANDTGIPTWDEISGSDLFRSMPAKEREQVRLDFFNDFVAPNVPNDALDDVRASFDQDTRPVALGLTSIDDFKRANPEFAQVPDAGLFEHIHQKYYPEADKDTLAIALGYDDGSKASAGDYGRAVMAGFAGLAEAAGKGVSMLPGETATEVGRKIQDVGKESADWWQEGMTPAGKRALSNEIVTDDFEIGKTPLQSIGLQALISAPSMLGAAIPGAGIVSGVSKLGGSALAALAKHPGVVGFIARHLPTAIGFGVAEGGIAALQNASQTEYEVRGTPIEKLRAESPTFQKFYAETDPALPQTQREALALDATAKVTSDDVALKTLLSTGGIGIATGGGAMGMLSRMFGVKAAQEAVKQGFIKTVAKGIGQEALQETPQSGMEAYIQNKAIQENVAPDTDPTKGAVSQALGGGIVGGVTGGVVGGAGYFARPGQRDLQKPDIKPASTDEQVVTDITQAPTIDAAIQATAEAVTAPPAADIPLALPAPRVIVSPTGAAATETQLANKAIQDAELGITPDIRGIIDKNLAESAANRTAMQAAFAKAKQAEKDKQQEASRRVPTLLEAVIRAGGISPDDRMDTIGDTRGNKSLPGVGHLFTKTGDSIDGVAEKLTEAGWFTEEQRQSGEAVNKLQEMIKDELSGIRQYTAPSDINARMQREFDAYYADRDPGIPELSSHIQPVDLNLSGYNKADDQTKDMTALYTVGREKLGDDAFETLAERVATQRPDATDEEFERIIRKEIESYAKPETKVPTENRPGAENVSLPVPLGKQATREGQGPAEEVAPPVPEVPATAPTAPAVPGFGDDNKVFTKERADKAREILRKKLSQLNAGLDPELMQAAIELSGHYIEGGARKFKDFSTKMVADLGEAIKPYLKALYLSVRNWPGFDNKGMQTEAEIDADTKGQQADMFGGKDETKQAIADREVERQRKMRESPPVESGSGDLFSGKSRQTDIEDVAKRQDKPGIDSGVNLGDRVTKIGDDLVGTVSEVTDHQEFGRRVKINWDNGAVSVLPDEEVIGEATEKQAVADTDVSIPEKPIEGELIPKDSAVARDKRYGTIEVRTVRDVVNGNTQDASATFGAYPVIGPNGLSIDQYEGEIQYVGMTDRGLPTWRDVTDGTWFIYDDNNKILEYTHEKPIIVSKAPMVPLPGTTDMASIPSRDEDEPPALSVDISKPIQAPAPVTESQKPSVEQKAEPKKEEVDHEPQRFKEGDRVVLDTHHNDDLKGRHGVVTEARRIGVRMVTIFGGGPEKSSSYYTYTVKTDGGVETTTRGDEMTQETGEAPSVTPDVKMPEGMYTPGHALHLIEMSKSHIRKAEGMVERARKPESIAEHKRSVDRYRSELYARQASFDAWAAKYPDEAAKVRGNIEGSKAAETWWNNGLTSVGREKAAKEAGVRIPTRTIIWSNLTADDRGKLIALKESGWNPDSTETAPDPTTATTGEGDSAATLKAAGLTVRKTKTNNGNDVWEVAGDTRTHKDMLKSLGGRWYGPKKVWSFYKADPSESIANRLGYRPKTPETTTELDPIETAPARDDTLIEETANATTEQRDTETADRVSDLGDGAARGTDSGPLAGRVEGQDAGPGAERETLASPETADRDGSQRDLWSEDGRTDEPPRGPRDSGTVRTERGSVTEQPERTGTPSARTEAPSKEGVSVSGRHDFTITDADEIGAGGLKTKYRNNVAAIRLLKKLESEDRRATPEEQATLAKYVGWGGIKGVFDPDNKEWSGEYAELKGLLADEEYEAARRSILDAHYTSVPIVRGIWSALTRLGFKGGKVLEPSVGVGNFLGLMPKSVRGASDMLGVELDRITGAITKQLYQHADIVTPRGFQDVNLPSDSFDVAIGNPPFGSQSIHDPQHKELGRFSIHNYFFAKSLDKIRPGGLMAMVVSRYFMDAQDPSARAWIAKDARLVAAFRLPYTAFKGNANTEVVTDIVILQKLRDGETADDAWVNTVDVDVDGKAKRINQHFAKNPKDILGRLATTGSMYSKDELTVEPVGDFVQTLTERIEALPENIYEPFTREAATPEEIADGVAPETVDIGGFFVTPDGKIARRLPDSHKVDDGGNPVRQHVVVKDLPDATQARIRGLIKVRDALRDLMRAELTRESDAGLDGLRAELNRTYDRFVKMFGYINSIGNRRAFQDDPRLPLLESLEPEYDPGVSSAVAKKSGIEPRKPKAEKAAIFTRRVLAPRQRITHADSPKDALVASLNEKGAVDLEYMRDLTGSDVETLTRELSGLIYLNPESGQWETADAYLTGNVKAKLAEAKAAAKDDARYNENIEALERVQPAPLTASDISVRLGSTWVPADVVAAFTKELLEVDARVAYISAAGQWSFSANGSGVAFEATWGTKRMPADKVIEAILNLKPLIIKDNIGTSAEPDWRVNEKETQAARAKAEDVQQKFKDWVWLDPARRERLESIYNDRFNTNRRREFNGAHLTFPGMSPTIELRKHQKDAIWRAIQERATLLDHVVGAGKTFEKVAIAMEMRRLGIARKPIFTVPNHLVRQWRDEFYRLYPNANILATTEKDFQKANRERLFSRIATGDWDAVIVAHSSFKKIGMPADTERNILNEMMKDIADAIEDMKNERGDRNVIRDMERIKENLKAKMSKLADRTGEKDKAVTFDELGADALFVDEAHLFKNLFYTSRMSGVAGLGNASGSGRAFDLFVKTRYLQNRTGGKGAVVFATGTPVSNSLVEMFTMQRYMIYDDLKDRGIHLLDAWARVFGDVQQVYEVHPSGSGYRLATRFAKFVNMPELMTLYRAFADVITLDDLKAQAAAEGKRFPVPKQKGGKPTMVVAERSAQQTKFFGVPEFRRGEGGAIAFKHDALDIDEREGKFLVVEGKAIVAGPFDTRDEAEADRSRLLDEPLTQYNNGSILWKFENLRDLTRKTDGKINALSVTNEARKAGLDYRLIEPDAPDFAGSKINLAAGNIVDVYNRWNDDKGTQLVFCDLSVPASARDKVLAQARKQAEKEAAESLERAENTDVTEDATEEQAPQEEEEKISMDQLLATKSKFSVYDDLKQKLIERGIPEDEIAFIHDYDTADKKNKMFQAVRDGRIRVLLGSTEKMGAGMNVQDRLVAIHHLDAPWRPSDLEQRNGRIIRQGNKLYERDPDGFEIEEYRYATKQTYDTRMWQIIEHKALGVEQLRKADETSRTIDDISGEAASAADMKAAASGNPLILDEIRLRNEVQSLEAQESNHMRSLFDMQRRIQQLEKADERYSARMTEVRFWMDLRDTNPSDPFSVEIGGKTYSERKSIGGPMISMLGEAAKNAAHAFVPAGVYRGVHFGFQASMDGKTIFARVSTDGKNWSQHSVYGKGDQFSPSGFLIRLDNTISNMADGGADAKRQLDADKAELEKARAEADKPFNKKAMLDETRGKHRDVVRKLQQAGGGDDLTPEMRQELEEARAKRRGVSDKPMFRRGQSTSGLPVSVLRAHISKAIESLTVPVRLYGTAAAARADGIETPDDARGFTANGRIGLIAENLPDLRTAEATLWHEVQHAGIRALNKSSDAYDAYRGYQSTLTKVAMANPNVRQRAAEWLAKYGKDKTEQYRALGLEGAALEDAVRIASWDEAIADMAGEQGGKPIKFLHELIAALQRLLRALGFENLADWMEGKTDAEVLSLIRRSMAAVMSDTTSGGMPGADAPAYSNTAPIYYSALLASVESVQQPKATADQWKGIIKNLPGVKADEVEWLGVNEWLDEQKGAITKDTLLDFIRANQVEVREVVRGGSGYSGAVAELRELVGALELRGYSATWEQNVVTDEYDVIDSFEKVGEKNKDGSPLAFYADNNFEGMPEGDREKALKIRELSRTASVASETTFEKYTLPGGENYRELLLTLPYPGQYEGRRDVPAGAQVFRSPHFDEPNVLAHVRFNERTDADGKRVLFIEEIQSDWHQKGRKEGYGGEVKKFYVKSKITGVTTPMFDSEQEAIAYRDSLPEPGRRNYDVYQSVGKTKGVPNAPFKTTWPLLAFKRMIRYASEQGFDRLAWTTGEQQAARYDLSKHIDTVDWSGRKGERTWAATKDGKVLMTGKEQEAEASLGKEIASKIIDADGLNGELSGLDLKIGGEGMKAFYDQMLPSMVSKYVKKWGGKVVDVYFGQKKYDKMFEDTEPRDIPLEERPKQPGLDITPAMREAAMQGQPMFARGGTDSTGRSVWRDRADKTADYLIYNYQDKFIDLKRIQKRAGDVPEDMDAYLAQERYPGQVSARVKDFHDDLLDPLVKAMHDAGLSYDEVEQYLHARHAPSRNAAMRQINPTEAQLEARKAEVAAERDRLRDTTDVKRYIDLRRRMRSSEADIEDGLADESLRRVMEDDMRALMRDSQDVRDYTRAVETLRGLERIEPYQGDNTALSGMSDEKAAEIIEAARRSGRQEALDRVAGMVDEITTKTREVIVDAGLEKPETIAAWEAKYENYVPLHRDEVGEFGMPALGQGYNIRGPESKRATGSTKDVTDILAHVAAQHEAAIIRAEKVKVDRALYDFARANPDESLWTLDTADKQSVVDPVTGTVTSRVNPLYKLRPNVLTFKLDGEERTITFNEKNPEAMRLAVSMKNLAAHDLGEVTKLIGRFTRFLATMNTSANPVFVARNFMRDLSTAFINLSDTELADMKKDVYRDIPKAIRGFWQMARGNTDTEWGQYAREFRDAGGQTGWLDHYKDIGARAGDLRKQLAALDKGAVNFTKQEAFKWWSLIEDANLAVENGVRLSSYVNARKAGLSEGKAASIAKNLTVNFNRHGAKGVELNMWYMFMNASIQGTARLVKAMGNRNVQKIIGYVIASGFLMDILARALAGDGDDDGENDYDQLAEHVKAMNFVFWVNGRAVTIPMPYGYNFFASVGRKMSEAAFRKNYSPLRSATDLVNIAFDAFSPTGQSGSMLQFVAPTIADPFVQWAENKAFHGGPLRREQLPFGPPKPEYQMGFKSTSAPAKWLAETLNDLTGGNEVRPGFINMNPAMFDFAVTSLAGGAGRTYLQAFNLPIKTIAGDEIQPREVPFVNIFSGAKPEYQTERKFYENIREVERARDELKHYRSDSAMTREIRERSGAEIRLAGRAKFTLASLEALRKQERQIEKSKSPDVRKRLGEIAERKRAIMARFNKAYTEAQQ